MSKINIDVIRIMIEEELYETNRADRDTIYLTIKWLLDELEINEIWVNNAKKQEKSLERYIFDGIVDFMKLKNINADELYNYEDESEIFDCIHGF